MRASLVGMRHCDYDCSLALGYLKAYAESRPGLRGRVEISLAACRTADPVAAVVERILSAEPDLVGFSCYLWNIDRVRDLCGALKSRRPGLRIALGGPEVSARPAQYLDSVSSADFIVAGEGEATFAELLESLEDGRPVDRVKGLLWRSPEGPRANEPRPLLDDLNAIPSPFLTGILPIDGFSHICFESDRGCPFDCKFCDWQNKRRVRVFDEARVIEETRLILERFERPRIFMCDADMFLNRERGRRLAKAFRSLSEGKRAVWEMHTYLPNLGLDEELIASLDCEKFIFAVGVQSVNPKALRAITRFFDDEKTRANAAMMRRLAPRAKINAQLIYGLPGDDLEGFERSLDYVLSLYPDSTMLFPASALPGSGMGDHPERYGIRCQDRPPYRVLSTDTFSESELRRADFLAFHNFTFQGVGFVSRTLRYLGACLEGIEPMSHLAAMKGFARSLAGSEFDLDALYRRASRDLLGFVTFMEEPWGGDLLDSRGPELIDHLSSYARAALEGAGRAEAWPALQTFLEHQRYGFLWRRLTRTAAFHRLLAKVGAEDSDGRALWIGCEEFANAESALGRSAQRLHWVSPLIKFDDHCPSGGHFRSADLKRGVEEGILKEVGGFGDVVLSQVCRWVEPERRAELFSGLRRRVARGRSLMVLDSLAQPSPVESDRAWFPNGVQAPPRGPLSADRLAVELGRAGWSLRRKPLSVSMGSMACTVLSAEAV